MGSLNTARAGSISTERMQASEKSCPLQGRVVWQPAKSLWYVMMAAFSVYAFMYEFTLSGFLVFVLTTVLTICCGHSVGMHRLLIHKSFRTAPWLERVLVYIGSLVSMAGPIGVIHLHDLRDWAQRQPQCHAYFIHRNPIWRDAMWQLHCTIKLKHSPHFRLERRVAQSWFYRILERTLYLQQLPPALLLYWLGGWNWVIWGICVRVFVSLTGHWLIGYFAHQSGKQNWQVDNMCVQGANVPGTGMLSMGEGYHNNHHAHPDSARLGKDDTEPDPGWWFIQGLRKCGLAWEIKQHEQEHAP